jgi:hypothetical protein
MSNSLPAKALLIQSKDRTDNGASPYHFSTNLRIGIQSLHRVRLLNVNLMNVSYNIFSTTQPIKYDSTSFIVNNVTYTLTPGAYSIYDLISVINAFTTSTGYTASYNPITMLVTLTGGLTINWSLMPDLAYILGFAPTDVAGTQTGTLIIKVSVPYNLLLNIDFLGSSGLTTSQNNAAGPLHFSYCIPVCYSNSGESISFNELSNYVTSTSNKSINFSTMYISLTRSDGIPLYCPDTNFPWTILLSLE